MDFFFLDKKNEEPKDINRFIKLEIIFFGRKEGRKETSLKSFLILTGLLSSRLPGGLWHP